MSNVSLKTMKVFVDFKPMIVLVLIHMLKIT